MQRTKTFVIAFWAALAQLVVVAASGNQYVHRHLIENTSSSTGQVRVLEYQSLVAFPWRVTPLHGQSTQFVGDLVAAAGLVVLTFLLVSAALSGQRRRRALAVGLTIWGIVVLLAVVLAFARTMIVYSSLFPGGSDPLGGGRFYYAVYDGIGSPVVVFGLVAGFVVGLVGLFVSVAVNPPLDQVGPAAAATGSWSTAPAAGPTEPWGDHPREEVWQDGAGAAPVPAAEWQRPWQQPVGEFGAGDSAATTALPTVAAAPDPVQIDDDTHTQALDLDEDTTVAPGSWAGEPAPAEPAHDPEPVAAQPDAAEPAAPVPTGSWPTPTAPEPTTFAEPPSPARPAGSDVPVDDEPTTTFDALYPQPSRHRPPD